jgi:hypothetical protein
MVFLFRLGRRKGEIGIHDADTGTGARAHSRAARNPA